MIIKKTTVGVLSRTLAWGLVGSLLGWTATAQADSLIHFPFNEGEGYVVTDVASGLTGIMGLAQNPDADFVTLTDTSPSGLPGDRSMTTSGNGFLIVDDSVSPILAITNGPITIETWLYIDPFGAPKVNEGIVGYGNSYKLGMRGGQQVFTLFGIADITNTAAPPLNVGQWIHVAAAWEPGVGVHFYLNGESNFTAHTSPAARPPVHNWLGLGSEGLGNNIPGSLDRVRIHHALLTADQLDSVAAVPKAPLPSTVVAYNFNEANLPAQNAVSPPRPTQLSHEVLGSIYAPVWTSDSPSGLPGDYSLSFLGNFPVKEYINVNYGSTPVDLGANNTNYTLQAWVKLPTGPMEERRVIYRTAGIPRVALSINADRTLHTTLYGNADFASPVQVPNDGRWHHVAVVMEDFARVHFYLDGILRHTVNRTAAAVNASSPPGLLIGKESETRYFRGLLDRVIIHNVALNASTLDFPAIPGLPVFPTFASHPGSTSINLGDSVVFTAAPVSATAATYQWYYRTNLADEAGVAIPGATSTTLPVNNTAAEDLGYYSVVVRNDVGEVESYRAQLALIVDLSNKPFTFEPPTYRSGLLEDQDGWSNNFNGGAVRVLTAAEIANELAALNLNPSQPVHSGSQAVLIGGLGLASTTIRPITGLETEQNVKLDVWVRPLPAAGGTAIGNIFFTMENAAGTRAAAFRLGPALSIDYGTAITGVWQATGLTADPNTWYKITMDVDYAAKTYDFFVDGVKVNISPIPFYTATADSFRQIRIFRGASQAGMIMDDLIINEAATALSINNINLTGSTITVTWEGGQPPYQLQRRSSVTQGTWENVGAPTSSTQATDEVSGNMMFYRVVSN
jgi:hypothetical protein